MTTSDDALQIEIAKIADSDAFFKNLLESAPDGMIIVDDKGQMILVNKQASRMFG